MSVEETRPILAPDGHEAHEEPKPPGLGKLAIATTLFGMLIHTYIPFSSGVRVLIAYSGVQASS